MYTTMDSSPISNKNTKRGNHLFILLTGFFLVNALLAEIIGVKIFSLETSLSLPPAQIPLFSGSALDFNLTAGVLIWPVVFVTTDLINEYYGYSAVKKVSILAAIMIGYCFIAIWITTELPPAEFWLTVNKTPGNPDFDINHSYNTIFRQGLGIIVGSLFAFLLGQFVDAYTFQSLKRLTNTRKLWLRATGSTLISQFIDSFIVLFIAFYLFSGESRWTIAQIASVGTINYIYKFLIAILLTPLLYLIHYYLDRYLRHGEPARPKTLPKQQKTEAGRLYHHSPNDL